MSDKIMELIAEKREPNRPPRRKLGVKTRLALAFLALSLLMVLGGTGGILWVFWAYGRDLPEYSQLARYEPPVVSRIHAGDGALLAEYAIQKRVFVPVNAIPTPLIEAFLSAEDKAFYNHFGIDLKAMLRASITNIANYGQGRRLVGASTITQQVAKNFLLTNEVSIDRKIKEAILAIRMERAFSKDQLLALYLNEIYLGFGSYGVAAAALNYFDKPLNDLSLAEMAYLAALPKAPSNYHPTRRSKAAIGRRNWVLAQMRENGYITQAEAAKAQAEPLKITPISGVDKAHAPYFTEEVRRLLVARYGLNGFYTGGYSVRTTLDPALQSLADTALIQGLEALDKRQGWRGAIGKYDKAQGTMQEVLGQYASATTQDRFPAVVMAVGDKAAEIIVLESDAAGGDSAGGYSAGGYSSGGYLSHGQIPFELADWAYPPRNAEGVRPPPITSLTQALAVGDIILVQHPHTTPDRLARHEDTAFLTPDVAPETGGGAAIWALAQTPLVEGALIALDPHTGRVLAMTGGYNPKTSAFNRATQAQRQPGSAFKPFVYLAALDNGFSPITRILDAPLVVDQGPGLPKWKPANYTRKFYGPSIMRHGIEQSRNLMTARLAMALGMPLVQDYAKKFGIDDDMPPFLSMSLGAGETSLAQLTAAYGMIVNGGAFIEPTLIDRIQDRFGATVYRRDNRECRGCTVIRNGDGGGVDDAGADAGADAIPPVLADNRVRVTDSASAYQMVTMLEGVISRGTGRGIGQVDFAVAGKTGTTNDNTNAWFIGFTPDLVVGVYLGYDKPRPLGQSEGGASAAAPIFADFMRRAMAGANPIPFRRPNGVNLFPINPETGGRADAGGIIEAFKPGQRPREEGEGGSVIDVPSAGATTVAQPLLGLY